MSYGLFPFGVIGLSIVAAMIELMRTPKVGPEETRDYGLRDTRQRNDRLLYKADAVPSPVTAAY